MSLSMWSARDRLVVVAGLIGPAVVCGVLAIFRSVVPNTDAALMLVVAVVALASFGHRIAGVLASVSGAVFFDLLLTAPYQRLAIAGRRDVETFVLLLAVGLIVSELAVRGRRSRWIAATDGQYLRAIRHVHELSADGQPRSAVTAEVGTQLISLLGLKSCRFETGRFGGLPRLCPDGSIEHQGRPWDLDQYGMPDRDVELVASAGERAVGRFVLTPCAGVVPGLAARQCAAIIADLGAGVPVDHRQRA